MRHMVLAVPRVDLKQYVDAQLTEVGARPFAFEVLMGHGAEKDEPTRVQRIEKIE